MTDRSRSSVLSSAWRQYASSPRLGLRGPGRRDAWCSALALGQVDEDPESLLAAYAALRRWNLDLWARVPEADRARVGIHRERGPESFELTFRLLAGHGLVHLDQARRALEVVRRAPVG